MRSLIQDLRYGARMLVRNPGFTVVAVLTLALAIGANTAIFSLVNAVVLRPLPVHEPDRLVTVQGRTSYPDYLDYRERNKVFTGTAVCDIAMLGLRGKGRPELVLGQVVSGNYFDVVGVEAFMGRTFLPEEDVTEGSHPVAVISHDAWWNRFGADPGIVGKEVMISSRPFTVVGVAPEGFQSLHVGIAPEVWIPIMMQSAVSPFSKSHYNRNERSLRMIGRLKPGVSIAQAQAHAEVLTAQLAEEHPDTNSGRRITLVETDRDRAFIDYKMLNLFMVVLMGVVGLVLLIACVNVANLLLARAMSRQKEIAMRLALGAGRGRILRQLLTENLLLGLLAGAAGLLIALWVTRLIQLFEPPLPVPLTLDLSPDASVLVFTFGVSLLATVVFGAAPAIQTLHPALSAKLGSRSASSGSGPGRSRLQNALVVAQIGVSLFLLITAGLCIRSLQNARLTDVGFNTENLLVLNVNLATGQYDEGQGRRFFEQLIQRTEALSGVRSAAIARLVPLGTDGDSSTVKVDGYEPAPNERTSFWHNRVSPGYFKTMGIPVVEGRLIDERDRPDSPKVVVINETLAKQYWPNESALGKTIHTRGARREVVGIVKDGKYRSLGEAPEPYFYLPFAQQYVAAAYLHVKTELDPRVVVASVLHEIERLDPNLPVYGVRTMEEHMGYSLLPSKMLGTVIGAFGGLALLLALVGIYGVMAYSVGQRTQEFGIRTALGARAADILWLVLRQGVVTTVIGTAIGLTVAVLATRLLSSFLFGIGTVDPLTFGGVTLLLVSAVLVACYIPARRAAKVEPMIALQYE